MPWARWVGQVNGEESSALPAELQLFPNCVIRGTGLEPALRGSQPLVPNRLHHPLPVASRRIEKPSAERRKRPQNGDALAELFAELARAAPHDGPVALGQFIAQTDQFSEFTQATQIGDPLPANRRTTPTELPS